MMHGESTRSIWEGRIKNHLEPDWKEVPLDLITFDAVSEWAAKKRTGGLSWGIGQGFAENNAASHFRV